MRYIYVFRNLVTNKVYVGQTNNPTKRKNEHIGSAYKGKKSLLCHSIRKYGEDNFSFDVIEECEDHLSNEREIFWISHYDSFENGYNLTTGGEHFSHSESTKAKIGSALRGKHLSDEHKEKLRKANLGKKPPPCSEETLQKMSDSMKGKNTGPKSDEHKKKLSEAHKGKTLSDEHKEKLRNVTVSVETRKKLSAAGKGRLVSDETRLKQSEALKGKKRKPQSDEVKERRAKKLRGRSRSEETKQKMRDAWDRKRKEKKNMQANDSDIQHDIAYDDLLNEESDQKISKQ